MLEDQSPEGISGRLKVVEKIFNMQAPKPYTKFVESPHGRQIEKHLYHNAVKKKSGPKNKKKVSIDGRTMIDQRPRRQRNAWNSVILREISLKVEKMVLVRFWF